MSVRRVDIVSHATKPAAAALERELTAFLHERGISVTKEEADVVISLGGDGTMLLAAQRAHAADIPLLGVNLGTLGYLTEVDQGGERAALERLFAGEYEIEERMMLSCDVGGDRATSLVALNEVLVERTSRFRLVGFSVRIGGESLAAFNADGVIVATPTGSTAYALSAGGPIVSPRAACLVVVPVNAHMIFSRPFVLPPDEVVEISVPDPGQEASLSLDGAIGGDLASGVTVTARRHPRPLKLVRLSGPGFVDRLRIKLNLPG